MLPFQYRWIGQGVIFCVENANIYHKTFPYMSHSIFRDTFKVSQVPDLDVFILFLYIFISITQLTVNSSTICADNNMDKLLKRSYDLPHCLQIYLQRKRNNIEWSWTCDCVLNHRWFIGGLIGINTVETDFSDMHRMGDLYAWSKYFLNTFLITWWLFWTNIYKKYIQRHVYRVNLKSGISYWPDSTKTGNSGIEYTIFAWLNIGICWIFVLK